jgi:hypothetical protein
MSLAANSVQANAFAIQSLDGKTTIDLAGSSSILFVDYFEDILSPCITMMLQVTNSTSLINLLPIRGGEKVSLSITTAFGDLTFDGDNALYVFKVSDIIADSTSEQFVLHLVSRETITNETTRCVKRYDGKINESVKRILKEVLKTTKFKEENIQEVANTYSFIGNLKKPFNILTWLCPKSLPAQHSNKTAEVKGIHAKTTGVSGFLFYENREGFNFKSIDSLVSRTNSGTTDRKNIPTYTYTQVIESNTVANEFKILNYEIQKNSDLIKSLRVGMYSNYTYFYNIYTNDFSAYKYTLKDEIKKANKLGTNSDIAVSEELGDSMSRILFRTSDVGIMDNDFTSDTFDESQQRDIADMAKSASRYNILFTQSLNMVVPCNVQLKVGDIIYAEFPRIERGNNKRVDNEQSGLYLIKELRHHMEPGTVVTSLRLIRDSYGLYGAENIT